MSTITHCDGCGIVVQEPVDIGHVIRRQYCAECAPKATAFIEAEESLRKSMQAQFVTDRELLIANMSEGSLLLPDVPV